MRTTLADINTSRIPASVGECAGNSRLIQWLNEAQQRLLTKGLWWGTYGKYRIAAYDGCITLPPELATVESVAINHVPIPVHDLWFEFLDNGFGTRSPNTVGSAGGSALGGATGVYGIPEANYRGSFPTFRDLTNNTNAKKIVLVCDLAADIAVTVTVFGYDANGNWIRTKPGSVYQDGETITLAQTPGTTSTNTFSRITDIQFSANRSGQVWLYELDTVTNVQTLTGRYQWFENNPSYGRWLFPSIFPPASNSTCTPPAGWQQNWTQSEIPSPSQPCNPSLVEVIGKKAFIPVALPSDYLIIGNIPALKFMMQAIKKEEDAVGQSDLGEAIGFETKALKELDDELDHYLGSGRRMGLNIQGSSFPDGQPIESMM